MKGRAVPAQRPKRPLDVLSSVKAGDGGYPDRVSADPGACDGSRCRAQQDVLSGRRCQVMAPDRQYRHRLAGSSAVAAGTAVGADGAARCWASQSASAISSPVGCMPAHVQGSDEGGEGHGRSAGRAQGSEQQVG